MGEAITAVIYLFRRAVSMIYGLEIATGVYMGYVLMGISLMTAILATIGPSIVGGRIKAGKERDNDRDN